MKRVLLIVGVLSMVFILAIPLTAMAQGQNPDAGTGTGPYCEENFIDEDGDGVCDLMGTGQGNGRMNGRMSGRRGGNQGMGQGPNFVDADEDGVCDHHVDTDGDGLSDGPPRDGTGMQHGRRGRGGHGANFGAGNGL